MKSRFTEMYRERQMRKNQDGMTLVELMIALTILVIGMGGVMIMIATAMATNNGTNHDSNGTMLAQMVTEQIISIPGSINPPPAAGPPANPAITDCAGVPHTIAVAGAVGPLGAGALVVPQPAPAGRTAGDVDFTQAFGAVPLNYAMQFVACGDAGRQPTYDVRWNVQTLGAPLIPGGATSMKLVTVAARRIDRNNRTGVGFSIPITIRTTVGL